MTRDESKTALLAALDQGPKVTAELYDVVQMRGTSLGNLIRELLHKGLISRETTSRGRYRYYIGHTAPAGSYEPARRAPKPKPATVADRMAFPVKQTRIWVGDRFNAITIPAAPWEVAA